jgi:hypothetical protein
VVYFLTSPSHGKNGNWPKVKKSVTMTEKDKKKAIKDWIINMT